MDETDDEKCTFTAADGGREELTRRQLKLSDVLTTLAESTDDGAAVGLSLVCARELALVAAYLRRRDGAAPLGIPSPLTSVLWREVCPDPWDADFVEAVYSGPTKMRDLANLCKAADYLGVVPLVTLCAARIACICRLHQTDPEQLRIALTPEDE